MDKVNWIKSKRNTSMSIILRTDEHIEKWIDQLREWAKENDDEDCKYMTIMLESADMLEQLLIAKHESEVVQGEVKQNI